MEISNKYFWKLINIERLSMIIIIQRFHKLIKLKSNMKNVVG